jgi:hypothetical protein
MHDVAK